MQCRSCGTMVSSTFKYAISQNICPACGKSLLDEESLALIEDVSNTIRNEAAVREETAYNLSVVLVSRYNITPHNNEQMSQVKPIVQQSSVQHKVAPPSTMKQAMTKDIVSVPEIPEGISEQEREKMLEEAVRNRYNMVDQIQADVVTDNDFDEQDIDTTEESIFSEGSPNPILERERLARLSKQQRAMNGGGQGLFRRGS